MDIQYQVKAEFIKLLEMLITTKIVLYSAVLLLAAFGYFSYRQATPTPLAGDSAPNFSLVDAKNVTHQLSDYRAKWLVLYFYPKDDTPGCTAEACHFRDDMTQLTQLGASVVGISVDDGRTHSEFAKKYNLPFPLLSDKNGTVAASYGALTNLFVIKFAKRYTFLINPAGKIAKVYLDVNTSAHSQQIIDDLKNLQVN